MSPSFWTSEILWILSLEGIIYYSHQFRSHMNWTGRVMLYLCSKVSMNKIMQANMFANQSAPFTEILNRGNLICYYLKININKFIQITDLSGLIPEDMEDMDKAQHRGVECLPVMDNSIWWQLLPSWLLFGVQGVSLVKWVFWWVRVLSSNFSQHPPMRFKLPEIWLQDLGKLIFSQRAHSCPPPL